MEILKYHSRNKPLENESILSSVAEVTQVWARFLFAFLPPFQKGSPSPSVYVLSWLSANIA